ncbi:MAG: hypothetical protein Q8P59_15085 [Dehalococcoidia bacterium]|nr:hypothetical protein [Dehalococcoidia bacterium]
MMALDEHPRADLLIFADTHHEGEGTYDFARQWTPWLGEHGLTVVTVEGKRTEVVREDWGDGSVLIPAFTVDSETGAEGQIRRQCTHDWKITPIRHWIREELSRQSRKAAPGAVECWQGISLDEALRMRTSDVKYLTNVYPLVDLRMTRMDCIQWLEARGLPIPPKSACTFCPFKSVVAWRELKRQGGVDWQEAVEVDEAVREKRKVQHGLLYVHPARKPLSEAVDIPEDHGAYQINMDIGCEGGYCMT